MFENEVKRIMNCYYNSIDLINGLNAIYAPYEYKGRLYGQIFDIGFRLVSEHSILNKAKEALKYTLSYNELRARIANDVSIEELADYVKNTNINDFYYALVEYIPSRNKNVYSYSLGNNEYKENRVHTSKLLLILNCLWLLDNDDVIDTETRNRIYKLSENGETFVFMDCKVTRHKNANLKIVFSNDTLFKRFKMKFDTALTDATRDFEEKNKE